MLIDLNSKHRNTILYILQKQLTTISQKFSLFIASLAPHRLRPKETHHIPSQPILLEEPNETLYKQPTTDIRHVLEFRDRWKRYTELPGTPFKVPEFTIHYDTQHSLNPTIRKLERVSGLGTLERPPMLPSASTTWRQFFHPEHTVL